MKLYSLFRSSASFRVRIALAIKGIAYETMGTALLKNEHRTPQYLKVNPQGLIPSLDIGDDILTQSLAIIEYLDEVHPQPALLPRDPIARAHVRSLALAVACDIHPLNNLRVLNHLKQVLGHDEEVVNTWYRHWIDVGFTGLEPMLSRFSSKRRFCFEDEVSMADVLLLPQVYNAHRFKCDMSKFPTIAAIAAHLDTLPAFVAAKPENQPDAV